mgnify:CR=1 FL=1
MDFQDIINTGFAIAVTGLLAFGKWIVAQINTRPTRAEIRELFDDKQLTYMIYIQDIKEDIRRLEAKIDKLFESSKSQ